MARYYDDLNYDNVCLEIHANYRDKFPIMCPDRLMNWIYQTTYPEYINRFINRIDRNKYVSYLDWWVNWIKAAPVEIKYADDKDLLFSHPLAFCNLIIDGTKFLIGFDLWDKYPLYTSNCDDTNIIDRWKKCSVYFKTNYFDAESPYRYRAPLGYVPREHDVEREKAEEAFWTENVFPGGMPLSKGKYFLDDKYKSFRSKRKIFDVNSLGGKKTFCPLRDEMAKKMSHKYGARHFIKSYVDYLKILGKTKICIDFPSNSRVTFRSSEAIAMGSLLVGPPVCNIYPEGFKLQDCMCICKSNLFDFNDKIEYYLNYNEERQELTDYAMTMWDNIMSPERLSEYWIKTSINYLIKK